jgi:hypothetical protein
MKPIEELTRQFLPHHAPLLFLDIDGVLNGDDTETAYFGFTTGCPQEHSGYTWLCPHRIAQLNKIIEAVPETQIVLSSTWRAYGTEAVEKMLQSMGFEGFLYSATPRRISYTPREMEISAWFEERRINWKETPFAILDDLNMDTIWGFRPHHVQTTHDPNIIDDEGNVITIGFTDEQVKQTITLLKGQST